MNTTRTLLLPACLAVMMTQPAAAQEYPIDGYSNYYEREGTFDWAKNCRIVADLPAPGTSIPARATLQFVFEHDQERLAVFQGYSRGTTFDLGFDSGGSFSYQQVRATTRVNGRVATVQFNSVDLNAKPDGESRFPFEIYGDCERCSAREALPPDSSHTSWRLFGTIVIEAAAGKVVTCKVVDIGSQEPDKELPSRDPDYYPERKSPRPTTFGVASSSGKCCCHCPCRSRN